MKNIDWNVGDAAYGVDINCTPSVVKGEILFIKKECGCTSYTILGSNPFGLISGVNENNLALTRKGAIVIFKRKLKEELKRVKAKRKEIKDIK